MPKINFGLILVLLPWFNASGQHIQFEQVLPPLPEPQIIADFVGVTNGSVNFADIDGDLDDDVLLTGSGLAVMYENLGDGNYIILDVDSLVGVRNSSAAFADIDGDGDQDLMITGRSVYYADSLTANLYINNGFGGYEVVAEAPFDGVERGSVAFEDVDGDGDQDLLITGLGSGAKLYLNDGFGFYQKISANPFETGYRNSIGFADIDGDMDQDLLIAGSSFKLYTNNGNGEFTISDSTTFESLEKASLKFVDIDGDLDQDVLISGLNDSDRLRTNVYINDGNGNFIMAGGFPFIDIDYGSIDVADIDGDLDMDILITGRSYVPEWFQSAIFTARLYLNLGDGEFTELTDTDILIPAYSYHSIGFSDVDKDGDEDLLVGGVASTLYLNDGNGNFSRVKGTPIEPVKNGDLAYADIDGDLDQDLLVTGENRYGTGVAILYENDGTGIFKKLENTGFEGVTESTVAFSDLDGDSDQDVVISGNYPTQDVVTFPGNEGGRLTKLFTNRGNGTFYEYMDNAPLNGFRPMTNGTISFADIDGDIDIDILMGGRNGSSHAALMYENDGLGAFDSKYYPNSFTRAYDHIGATAFADVDGDQDQDILITGWNYFDNDKASKLYFNDGLGEYSPDIDNFFIEVWHSSVAFADIDGDLDQDLLITGESNGEPKSILYANDGDGNFSIIDSTTFEGVVRSTIVFFDVDNDMDQDVLLSGIGSNGDTTVLYTNNGIGNFKAEDNQHFDIFANSAVDIAIADIDLDNDADILLSGYSNKIGMSVSRLYRNISMPCISSNITLNQAQLAPLENVCLIEMPTTPYATNSCGNAIAGVPDIAFPIDVIGTTTITWHFDDGNGNVVDQTQDAIIYPINNEVIQEGVELIAVDQGYTYQWIDCNNNGSVIPGEINQSFISGNVGSFAVIIGNADCNVVSECFDITAEDLIIANTANTNESQDLILFPNPTTGIVNICLPEKQEVYIDILSVQGRCLESFALNDVTGKIDLSSFPSGTYIIKFVLDDVEITRQIIKK